MARLAAEPALALALAAVVFGWSREHGAYGTQSWASLGALLTICAAGLLAAGRRPSPWSAAASLALAGMGAVAAASVLWSGLPDVAWTRLDQALLAAAALLTGSMLAGDERRRALLVDGVGLGIALLAFEVLYRLTRSPLPADWIDGRKVQGPVGYHNALGAFFAVGVPLALHAASHRKLPVRVLAGASLAGIEGALLVTQSRGALLAAALAAVAFAAITRDVRVLAIAGLAAMVGAMLISPLRDVDAALVDSTHAVHALRHYVAWTAVGALVLAAAAATPPHRRTVRRALALGTLAFGCAGAVAVVLILRPSVEGIRAKLDRAVRIEEPARLPGGTTRLGSLSLTGRTTVWRVAVDLYSDHPVLGAGSGSYARTWGLERETKDLYVLQPHSLELELLSENGLPGAALLAAFLVTAAAAVAGGRPRTLRRTRAAAAGALVALLVQASVDWTSRSPPSSPPCCWWSAPRRDRARSGPGSAFRSGAVGLLAVVALGLFGAPLLADRALERARAVEGDPARAWRLASTARRYDRWSPDVVAFQGRLAESTGNYDLAARLYAHAADLSQQPWVDEYRRARALRAAGRVRSSIAVCRLAQRQNPLEPLLHEDACADA